MVNLVVVEAGKRMAELETKARAKAEWKKHTELNNQSCEARKAHVDCVLAGSPVDEIGHPWLIRRIVWLW